MDEYQEDGNGVAGSVPEFGAIFMSNIMTKRECLKTNVFGLPLAQANFVKQVKSGMILFLFEFEKRQLFGVFRAVSDGEINIMSNAFKSSGKQFPAQVCFIPVWHCCPLSEYEFRDAIRDNYYSGRKFKFGLSENQVRRLLELFSTRKLKNEGPDRQCIRVRKPFVKERTRIDDARSLIRDKAGLEPDMHDGAGSAFLNEYGRDSSKKFKRVDGELYSRDNARENKNKIDCDQGDVFRGPGERDHDVRNHRYLMNGQNTDYNSGTIFTEHENCEVGRADLSHLVDNFSVKNEYDMGYGLGSSFTKEQLGEHPRKRATCSGSFFMNNTNSLGPVMSTDHSGKHLYTGSRATDEGRFQMNENVEHYNLVQDNLVGDDDIRYRKSNMVENDCEMESFLGPVGGYALSHSKQNALTYTGNSISQTKLATMLGRPWNSSGFPCSDECCIPHFSDSTSRDAVATRAAPYDPEAPHIFHRYSSSIAAGHSSSPDLDQPFPQSLMGNLCSSFKSESPPYQLEARGPRRYFDVDAGYGDVTSYPGHHKDSDGTMHTSALDGYSKSRYFKIPAEHGFSDLFVPDPSASFTRSKGETSEADDKSPISNSFFSNIKCEHLVGSQVKYGYSGGEGIIGEGLPLSDMGCSCLQNEVSDAEAPRRKDSVDNDDKFSRSCENWSSFTNNKRVSVFARLASAPDVSVQEKQHDSDVLGDKYDTEASVDKLMGMLHHSLSYQAKKIGKGKLNVKPQGDNRITNFKKNNVPTREREYGQSKLNTELAASQTIKNTGGSILEETRRVDFKRHRKTLDATYKENSDRIMECKQPAEENSESERSAGKELAGNVKVDGCGSILEETRNVDFKRRSKAKKTLDATYKENSAGIMECERPAEGNAEFEHSGGKELARNAKVDGSPVSLCKRRKLVRPVFGQKESEGTSCGIGANLQSAYLENSPKEQALTLQEANESSEIEMSSCQVASSANNKTNIIEVEKSLELEEKGNPQSPARRADDDYANHQPRDEGIPIITAQEPNSSGSKQCGWIEF